MKAKLVVLLSFLAILGSCSKGGSEKNRLAIKEPIDSPTEFSIEANPLTFEMRDGGIIVADSNTLNLGDIFVGTQLNQKIYISNTSSEVKTVNIGTISSQNFVFENNCTSLEPRRTCFVNLKHNATLAKSISETIEILGTSLSVNLNVISKPLKPNPLYLSVDSLNFGSYVGSKLIRSFNILNTSMDNINLTIENPTNVDFNVFTNCPSSLSGRKGCSVNIEYMSDLDLSKISETISSLIKVNSINIPISVLEENKTNDFTNIILSQSTLNFGNFESGQNKIMSVRVTNRDSKPKNIVIDSGNLGPFMIVKNTCSGVLEFRRSCNIDVRFTASQKGTFNHSLVIAGKTLPITASVPQGGILTNALNVSTELLDFGIMPSNSSKTMSLYIQNTSLLPLSQITVTTPVHYTVVSNSCSGTIDPRRTCKIDYLFQSASKPSLIFSENITVSASATIKTVQLKTDIQGNFAPVACSSSDITNSQNVEGFRPFCLATSCAGAYVLSADRKTCSPPPSALYAVDRQYSVQLGGYTPVLLNYKNIVGAGDNNYTNVTYQIIEQNLGSGEYSCTNPTSCIYIPSNIGSYYFILRGTRPNGEVATARVDISVFGSENVPEFASPGKIQISVQQGDTIDFSLITASSGTDSIRYELDQYPAVGQLTNCLNLQFADNGINDLTCRYLANGNLFSTSFTYKAINTSNNKFSLKEVQINILDSDNILDVYPSKWASLALNDAGSVFGRGLNESRVFGIDQDYKASNFVFENTNAIKVPLNDKVAKLWVKGNSAIAKLENGQYWAWGQNRRSRLGIQSYNPVGDIIYKPQQVTLLNNRDFIQITINDNSSCGLTSLGEVYCWGSNEFSELGTNITTQSYGDASQLRKVNFGNKSQSQLTDIVWDTNLTEYTLSANGGASRVQTISNWSIFLKSNQKKSVGDFELTFTANDTDLAHGWFVGASKTLDLEYGANLAGFLFTNGSLKTYGNSAERTIVNMVSGLNTFKVKRVGTNIQYILNGTEVDQINFGVEDSFPVTRLNGRIISSSVNAIFPKTASFLAESSIRSNTHCAIVENEAVCWGLNTNGQLGAGRTSVQLPSSANPVKVLLGENVKKIAIGASFNCAVTNSDRVKCWGSNSLGQLGLGDTTDRGITEADMQNLAFVNLGTDGSSQPLKSREVYIGAGGDSICSILFDYRVKCWGVNSLGQLGVGDVQNRGSLLSHMGNNLPYLKNVNNIDLIAAYLRTSGEEDFCLRSNVDTKVYCWGNNQFSSVSPIFPNTPSIPREYFINPGDTAPFLAAGSTVARDFTTNQGQTKTIGSISPTNFKDLYSNEDSVLYFFDETSNVNIYTGVVYDSLDNSKVAGRLALNCLNGINRAQLNSCVFTPEPNYKGTFVLKYKACSPNLKCSDTIITLNSRVADPNIPYFSNTQISQTFNLNRFENKTFTIPTATDPQGRPWGYFISSNSARKGFYNYIQLYKDDGKIAGIFDTSCFTQGNQNEVPSYYSHTMRNPTCTFYPKENFTGSATLKYVVKNSAGFVTEERSVIFNVMNTSPNVLHGLGYKPSFNGYTKMARFPEQFGPNNISYSGLFLALGGSDNSIYANPYSDKDVYPTPIVQNLIEDFDKNKSYGSNSMSRILFENMSSIKGKNNNYCATIGTNNKLACWGPNSDNLTYGQLNPAITVYYYNPENAIPRIIAKPDLSGAMTSVVDYAIGERFSCAIHGVNKSVSCWGKEVKGCGNSFTPGTPCNVIRNSDDSPLVNAKAIDVGPASACAIVTENSIDKLYCWGYKLDANGAGSISRSLIAYTDSNNYDIKAKEINIANPIKVSMGQQNACASSLDNKLYCWGFNGPYGLLGRGSSDGSLFFDPSPVKFEGNDLLINPNVFDVGSYNYYSDSACAQGLNSKLYCWGYTPHFKLWEKTAGSYNSAQEIPLLEVSPLKKIALSDSAICYQTIDNKLKCWGNNTYGQFGLESLGWVSQVESSYVKDEPTSLNPSVVSDFALSGQNIYFISPQLIENHEYYQQGSLSSQVAEQSSLNATLVSSLTENDEIVIMRKPSYGTISEGSTLTTLNYTPTTTIAAGGEPYFDYITYYKISDPSKVYKYVFEVTPINNPPIAQDIESFAFIANDKYFYNSTLGTEPEGQAFAIEFLTQPQHGTFNNCYVYPGFASQYYQYCSYRPNAGTSGLEENISYRLFDNNGYSATKNLKIKIYDNNALTPSSIYTEINTLSYYNTTFNAPRAFSPQGEATSFSIISGFLNDGGIYKVKTAEDITLGTIDSGCFLSGNINQYTCVFRPVKGIVGSASIKYRLINGSLQTPEMEIKINVGSNINNLLYSIGYVYSSFSGGGSYQASSYLYRLQGGTNPSIQYGDPYPIPHISKALIESPISGLIFASADGRHIIPNLDKIIQSSNNSEDFLAISNGNLYFSGSLSNGSLISPVSYYYGGYGFAKIFFNNNQPIQNVTSGAIGTNQACAIYDNDNKLACWGRTRNDSISQNEILRSGCGPRDTYTRKGFACPIVKRDLSQLNNVRKVATKNNSTCAVVEENGIGQVYCWGFRFDSNSNFDSRNEAIREHNTNYAEKVPGFEGDDVVDIVMLDNRACTTSVSGKISCFGQTSSYSGAKNRPDWNSKFMPKYSFIADAITAGDISLKQIVDEHVIIEVPINSEDNSGINLSHWNVTNEDDTNPTFELSNDRVAGGLTYKSIKIKLKNKKPYSISFTKDLYSITGDVSMVSIKPNSLITNNSVICGNSEENDFYCWGGDYSTQSLNNVQNQYFNSSEISKIAWMSDIEPFKSVKFGTSNMCLINLNDELKCWGLISYGNNGMESYSGATTYYVRYQDADVVKDRVDGNPVPVRDFISGSNSTLMLVENILNINVDPQPVELSVNENSSVNGLIADVDTSKYEYFIISKPNYGVLSGDITNLTYTATNNYNGQDQFTYRVYDKVRNYSVVKTVILKVKDANNLPKAEDRFYALEKNSMNFYVYFSGSDVDSNPLSYIVETQPTNGTLSSCTSSYCIYTPNNNYVGVDSFTYKVSDGIGVSSVKTVSLEIRDDKKPYFSNSLFEYNIPRNSSRYVVGLPVAKVPNYTGAPYYELVYNSNIVKEINNAVSFKQNGEIIATVYGCFMAQPIGTYSGDGNCEFKFNKQIIGTLSFEIAARNPADPNFKSDNITINLNIGNSGKALYGLGYVSSSITTSPLGHFETQSMEYRIRGGSLGNQQIAHLADKELFPVPMMFYNTTFNDVQMITSDDSGGICWQNNDLSKKVYCLNTSNGNNQFGPISFSYYTPGPIQDITYADNSAVANLQKIESGTYQTCGVSQDGKAMCWGTTLPWSVGPTTLDYTGCGFASSVTPRGKACNLVDDSNNFITNVIDISVGAGPNGCLIKNENSIGQVYCWGQGFDNPSVVHQSVKAIPSLNTKSAAKVSVGDNYVCVAYTDNTVKCMGSNTYGRVGINQTDGAYKPATELVFEDASQQIIGIKPHTLQTKNYMACVVDLNDKLQCWGYSDRGVLTKPAQYPTTYSYQYKPTRIMETQDVQSYALSNSGLCAVNSLQEVRCIGDNTYGHLGNPRALLEYNTSSVFNNGNYISESEMRPIKEYLGQTNIKVDDIVMTSNNTYVLINAANSFDVPLIDVQEISQDVLENEAFSFSLGSTDNLYYIFRRPDYAKISGDSPQTLLFTVADSQQNSYIDYITFLMRDMLGNSTVKKYVFKVTKQNDKPIYVNKDLVTYSGATLAFTHQATDFDSTTFTYTVTQQPLFGTLNCTGASCSYFAPLRNQNDPDLIDVIHVKAIDNNGAESAVDGIINIVIKPISNPVFDSNFVSFTIYENTPSIGLRLPRVKDPRNGNQIAYQQTNNTIRSIIHPTLGQIAAVYDKNNSNNVAGYITGCAFSVNPINVADISACTFTVLNNFTGTARFDYIASNGSEASAVVVVEIEVKPIGDLANKIYVTGYAEINRSGNMHKTAGQEQNYDYFVFPEQNESYLDSQVDVILNPVGNVENMYYNPRRNGWCIRKESSLYSGKFYVSCRATDSYVGRRLGPYFHYYYYSNADFLNQRFIPINDENNAYPQYDINSFAYGLSQTCATVGVDNELVCWGETQDSGSPESTARTSGCGFAHSITNSNIPCNIVSRQEEKIKNVIDLGLGGLDRCAIVDDNGFGRLLCWGYENAGKNGQEIQSAPNWSTERNFAMPIYGLDNISFREVEAGDNFACAETNTNTLYCWGYNKSGQLGRNTIDNQTPWYIYMTYPAQEISLVDNSMPVAVKPNTLSVVNSTACVIGADHQIYCWGAQTFSNFYDDGAGHKTVPTKLTGFSQSFNFKKLKMGENSMCGILLSDEVVCWGYNPYKHLGNLSVGGTVTRAQAVKMTDPSTSEVIQVKDLIILPSYNIMFIKK